MLICASCGGENQAGARFCNDCGAALATTLSYLLTAVIAWIFFRRVTMIRFGALIPRSEDVREARDAIRLLGRTARTLMRRR